MASKINNNHNNNNHDDTAMISTDESSNLKQQQQQQQQPANHVNFAAAADGTLPPPPRGGIFRAGRQHTTEETASDAHSIDAMSSDGNYEVIEYDLPVDTTASSSNNNHSSHHSNNNNNNNNNNNPLHDPDHYNDGVFAHAHDEDEDEDEEDDDDDDDIFNELGAVSIQEDSPAAAALRANAEIQVSSLGKAARAVHMQTVRRALKRAAGKGRSNRIKGKPPRVPYGAVGTGTGTGGVGMGVDDEEGGVLWEGDEHSHESEESAAASDEEGEDISTDNESFKKPHHLSVITGAEHVAPAPTIDAHRPPTKLPDHRGDDSENVDLSPDDELSIEHQQQHQQQSHSGPPPSPPKTPERPSDMRNHMPDNVVPGTVEAGKKVLGSVDPHDLLALVRWRRKKKGALAKIKQKSYVKGKVIDGQHELYTLSIAVMIGVRTSISRTNTELNSGPGRRWVRPADFRATEKYEFRPKGDGPLPPHQLAHTFKFKDYSPVVFAYLRRLSGVNEFDFLLSVCGNANFIEFISNAKSGQFFFYSSDGRYMIKTMTNAESKFLRRMLPSYFKHCCENPNAMVTRFFGMYRVKLYHLRRNVKFVIMNSVYYTDKHLQLFYDLKGSSVGRDAKPGQAVLKDNDLRDSLPENAFALRPKQRQDVRQQLVSDCDFLRHMGVMDYSMLVGVHHVPSFDGKASMTAVSGFRGGKKPSAAAGVGAGGASSTRARKSTGSSNYSSSSAVHDELDVNASPEFSPSHSHGHGHGHGDHMMNKGGSHRSAAGSGHNRTRSDTLGTYVFENGLEDDDNSYLPGSENRPGSKQSFNEETERKKQVTIEKLYWPFHHMFDIHGHRRLKPARCPKCNSAPCRCVDEASAALLKGYNIPSFVPPLSDRKDRGLEMDTTGLQMPMKLRTNGELLFEGKIFYMGIIDILQEYNSRKVLESRYRAFTSPARLEASCVNPQDYGRRFLAFFDQFTTRGSSEKKNGKGGDGDKEEEGIEI